MNIRVHIVVSVYVECGEVRTLDGRGEQGESVDFEVQFPRSQFRTCCFQIVQESFSRIVDEQCLCGHADRLTLLS
jgi:hypothetical protein